MFSAQKMYTYTRGYATRANMRETLVKRRNYND